MTAPFDRGSDVEVSTGVSVLSPTRNSLKPLMATTAHEAASTGNPFFFKNTMATDTSQLRATRKTNLKSHNERDESLFNTSG